MPEAAGDAGIVRKGEPRHLQSERATRLVVDLEVDRDRTSGEGFVRIGEGRQDGRLPVGDGRDHHLLGAAPSEDLDGIFRDATRAVLSFVHMLVLLSRRGGGSHMRSRVTPSRVHVVALVTGGLFWSSARTPSGTLLKILTVTDEYTKAYLFMTAARSFKAVDVIEALECLMILYGPPNHLRSHNGPAFVANATQRLLAATGVARPVRRDVPRSPAGRAARRGTVPEPG